MDALPTELVAQILSFLKDGKEVSLFKQLNSRIRGIINKYRSLRRPAFNVFVSSGLNGMENVIHFALYEHWECTINVSDLTFEITPNENENNKRINLFFTSFFERNPKEKSLKAFFMFIFERIDIEDLMLSEQNYRDTIRILYESIRETNTRVATVLYQLDTNCFPEMCDLLIAIGNLQFVHKEKSIMRCLCPEKCDDMPRIRKINEISTMYRSSLLCVIKSDAGRFMGKITEEWRKDPLLEFSFALCVVNLWDSDTTPIFFPEMKNFDVEMTNEDFLFARENECASVLFKDRSGRSGENFIIFVRQKTVNGGDPFHLDYPSKRVVFSIDACVAQ